MEVPIIFWYSLLYVVSVGLYFMICECSKDMSVPYEQWEDAILDGSTSERLSWTTKQRVRLLFAPLILPILVAVFLLFFTLVFVLYVFGVPWWFLTGKTSLDTVDPILDKIFSYVVKFSKLFVE